MCSTSAKEIQIIIEWLKFSLYGQRTFIMNFIKRTIPNKPENAENSYFAKQLYSDTIHAYFNGRLDVSFPVNVYVWVFLLFNLRINSVLALTVSLCNHVVNACATPNINSPVLHLPHPNFLVWILYSHLHKALYKETFNLDGFAEQTTGTDQLRWKFILKFFNHLIHSFQIICCVYRLKFTTKCSFYNFQKL